MGIGNILVLVLIDDIVASSIVFSLPLMYLILKSISLIMSNDLVYLAFRFRWSNKYLNSI